MRHSSNGSWRWKTIIDSRFTLRSIISHRNAPFHWMALINIYRWVFFIMMNCQQGAVLGSEFEFCWLLTCWYVWWSCFKSKTYSSKGIHLSWLRWPNAWPHSIKVGNCHAPSSIYSSKHFESLVCNRTSLVVCVNAHIYFTCVIFVISLFILVCAFVYFLFLLLFSYLMWSLGVARQKMAVAST